jgi:hypothetical protein
MYASMRRSRVRFERSFIAETHHRVALQRHPVLIRAQTQSREPATTQRNQQDNAP